jgi:hypothetical protein
MRLRKLNKREPCLGQSADFLIGSAISFTGDLSSVVLPGREIDVKPLKYRLWAEALFETTNSERPRLLQPVLLWVRAWRKDDSVFGKSSDQPD